MGFFSRILAVLTSGNAESQLKKGLELAKNGRPDAAIRIYDALLETAVGDDLRARILLNRALAYHAMSDDAQAEHDLKSVLACHQATETVRATAREKLARVQKRMLRTSDRANRS
jgi:tetratricopeptide (TPR) repeat protein